MVDGEGEEARLPVIIWFEARRRYGEKWGWSERGNVTRLWQSRACRLTKYLECCATEWSKQAAPLIQTGPASAKYRVHCRPLHPQVSSGTGTPRLSSFPGAAREQRQTRGAGKEGTTCMSPATQARSHLPHTHPLALLFSKREAAFFLCDPCQIVILGASATDTNKIPRPTPPQSPSTTRVARLINKTRHAAALASHRIPGAEPPDHVLTQQHPHRRDGCQ